MEFTPHLLPYLLERSSPDTDNCTKSTCPAEWSTYGYAPNLAANIFFVVIFAISAIAFAVQGFLRKGWTGFTVALTIGTAMESVGYIARILLYNNPFDGTGFDLNIVLLTIAPAFMTAGIYLLLKQFCLAFGPQHSRLQPKLYTWIFISCDILSIILQAAGGALSAIADSGSDLLDIGIDVMIAGLVWQVVTLLVFALLAGDFALRVRRHRGALDGSAAALLSTRRFRLFGAAVVAAFLFIFIRCAYRIAELQGGWGSAIMRDEAEFIVLESVMVMLAALVLNVFHPGFCFPRDNLATKTHRKVESHASDVEMIFEPPHSQHSSVLNKPAFST